MAEQLAEAPDRMAIVQPAGLAEVLSIGPLAGVLKLAWPAARLAVAVHPGTAGIAACIPGVDRVVPFDPEGSDKGLAGLRRVARGLGEPQVVLVAHLSMRSALLAWLTKASTRVGHESTVKGRLFTIKVPLREREPLAERTMDLARALGVEGPIELQLRPPAAGVEQARRILGFRERVGLVVSSDHRAARWLPESFAGLADRLDEAGTPAVLLGTAADQEVAEAVRAAARRAPPAIHLGDPVTLLCAAAALKGVVGADAGLVHLARAACPTLMLFGPTDPGGHTLEPHVQALRLGLECQPCEVRDDQECLLGHHGCMRNLEVDRVFDALADLIGRGAGR